MSVNVGLPSDVPWRGQLVHTGVWKEPVAGPRMVRRLNIDGDGQGDLDGHGGEQRAVLVYQLDSYRYLGGPSSAAPISSTASSARTSRSTASPTTRCASATATGSATAVFEVTQPRVTCYRVGIRMGEPRMAALLVEPRTAGVLPPRARRRGSSQAGDEIVKVASGPEAMTVAEVDALLYRPSHDREPIARALRIPALSPGWQGSFRTLLESARPDRRPRQSGPDPGRDQPTAGLGRASVP